MRNGPISDQARLLAAVGELDASPAPAMEVAAHRLVAVVEALVPSDLSKVWLGVGRMAYFNVHHMVEGRAIGDGPPGASRAGDHDHIVVTVHDSTGLLTTGRWSELGSCRSPRPAVEYGHMDPRLVLPPSAKAFWLPFGIANMARVTVDFPKEHAHLASYRIASPFSEDDVRTLDRLRPVASRLLRRAAVSSVAGASASAWALAPREAEVFAFAGVGLSLPSIASLLGIAVGTVRTQLGRAYAKTAVRSRAGATSALLDVVEPTALEDARRGLVAGELSPLTGRERTVLRIAATGRTTSSIASVIGISTETTKTHLANVYRKLGVQNRSQALLLVGATEDRRTLA